LFVIQMTQGVKERRLQKIIKISLKKKKNFYFFFFKIIRKFKRPITS
jgi:hypothetical protein